MFDSKQDIRILHGSLLSAANLKSDNLFDCADVKDVVCIVYKSIRMIIHQSLKEAKNEKEKINNQLHCIERLHAALFFTTLRSHGIKSQAADEFYDSILYNWPSVNLKFYVELNFKCDWNKYFIKSALQLPSETLLKVLKMIFEIPFENDVKCYSWHLILQILIFKLFEVSYNDEIHYPFNFDFIVDSTIVKKSLDEFTEKNFERQAACDKTDLKDKHLFQNKDKNIHKCDDDDIDESNNVSDSGNETLSKQNNSDQFSNKITELDDEDTEEESEYSTPFSYKISESDDDDEEDGESTKTKNESLLQFEELCYNLYDNIDLKIEKKCEIEAFKVLLHVANTISKFIKGGKTDYQSILPFQNYIKLLRDYLSIDINKNKISVELKDCSATFTVHAYATVSWNICLNYLIFLLEHNIEGIFPSDSSSKLPDDIDLFYKNLASAVSDLHYLNHSFLKSDKHVALLCKIIHLEFEGSSDAVKIILSDPDILKMKDTLAMLEASCHMINLSQTYSLIVDYIMTSDSPELKQSLLKILFRCLQMNKLDMYNSVIGYIITNYGFTEEFQLPDCNYQLSELSYETLTQEEIENKIPAFLIQNPKSTLKYLIHQALFQGPEGEIFIQFLKHFRNACFYIKKSGSVCILHEILIDYFNKPKLRALVLKNMVTLYKFLVKVHAEVPILLPCSFFSECIIPKLHPECERIKLLLECTHVLIPTLLSDDSFLEDAEILYNLIDKFAILVNYFIVKGDGEMKSLILSLLKDLELHQEKTNQIEEKLKLRLWSSLKNFGEMTCVYFEKFLPENIEFVSRAAVWIQCCKNENLSNFETKFSVENLTYTSLVNTLIEVLPHLTKKEWSYCFSMLKVCCTNNKVQEDITCSNNPFQLCGSILDAYAMISAVLTAVHFFLKDNTDGSLYMSCCVSNFLKDVLFQKEIIDLHLLLSVALEICHLIPSFSPDAFQLYHTTLLEIQKEVDLHSSETDENLYISKLLNYAVTCLPKLYQTVNQE